MNSQDFKTHTQSIWIQTMFGVTFLEVDAEDHPHTEYKGITVTQNCLNDVSKRTCPFFMK